MRLLLSFLLCRAYGVSHGNIVRTCRYDFPIPVEQGPPRRVRLPRDREPTVSPLGRSATRFRLPPVRVTYLHATLLAVTGNRNAHYFVAKDVCTLVREFEYTWSQRHRRLWGPGGIKNGNNTCSPYEELGDSLTRARPFTLALSLICPRENTASRGRLGDYRRVLYVGGSRSPRGLSRYTLCTHL